jgi:Zn-dependent peptidase ImmA (M78 family)
MTIMHEISHWFLSQSDIRLFSVKKNEKIRTFEDPEWQATALAAEILCPISEIENIDNVEEISKKFNISIEAARVQKDKQLRTMKKERKIN